MAIDSIARGIAAKALEQATSAGTKVSSVNGKTGAVTLTASDVGATTQQWVQGQNYLTEIPAEYVTETELEGKGYLTSIPAEYVTETELNAKGYLTSIPAEYVIESELEQTLTSKDYVTDMQLIAKDYVTNTALNAKGYLTAVPDEYVTDDELTAKDYVTNTTLTAKHYNTNKPTWVLYSDVFDLKTALEGKGSAIDKTYKYAVLQGGMLTWCPYISSSVAQTTIGFKTILEYIEGTTITDVDGNVWEPATNGAGVAFRSFTSIYDGTSGTTLNSVATSHVRGGDKYTFVEFYYSTPMLNLTGGINLYVQIPMTLVEN